MKDLEVERTPNGDVVLRHLPPSLAWALRELPVLLSDDAPGIASHLTPNPYPDDGGDSEEWARQSAPELRHLFVSARELVLEDLRSLVREPPLRLQFRLRISGRHVTAWLSALAAARVAMGETHEVDAEDMAREPRDVPGSERDRAILLIQILGWMQALLIG